MSTSLQSLPIEVRQKIYSLVLVEPDEIDIKVYNAPNPVVARGVARDTHKRNSKHRGQIYRGSRWFPVVSSNAELLRVSKQVQADAAPLFYGLNRFEFQTTNALERFLNQVGGIKAHIRHLTLLGRAFWHSRPASPYAALHRFLKALAASRDLRCLNISYVYFCTSDSGNPPPDFKPNVKQLVKHCIPLLKPLQTSYKAKNLAQNFLDVVNIEAPRCFYPRDQEIAAVTHKKKLSRS